MAFCTQGYLILCVILTTLTAANAVVYVKIAGRAAS
jgi:hypothetical protein